MRSVKPRPKKVSTAASDAFASLVLEAHLAVDESKWKESLGGDGTPLATDFTNYWQQVFASKDSAEGKRVLDLLPGLITKYPVEGEGEDQVRPDVTYVQDLKTFKAGLKVSVDPGPVNQWGDLPVSRF
jgi:insulysin